MSMTDNDNILASVKKASFYKSEEFEEALEIIDVRPLEAAAIMEKILSTPAKTEEEASNVSGMKEQCVYNLARIYASRLDAAGLSRAMNLAREFFLTISKPRSAKVLRGFLNEASEVLSSGPTDNSAILIPLCLEAVKWAEAEKRTFLRHRVQVRLAALYLSAGNTRDALALLHTLNRELKKLDDKPLIVEISLLEARAHMMLGNAPRAKSALTTARANAATFYCPTLLQAQMDTQAGEISAAEGDFKTAYSYFYEAFEAYSSHAAISKPATSRSLTTSGDSSSSSAAAAANASASASLVLRRMLLCKIMDGHGGDVHGIVISRAAVPFISPEIAVLEELVEAQKLRSVKALERMLEKHRATFASDSFLASQAGTLRDDILEQNLTRLIEPYSRVQLERLSSILELPQPQVEAKVAELILDGKINGVLDQESGDLVILDAPEDNKYLEKATSVVKGLDKVLDKLAEKLASVSAV